MKFQDLTGGFTVILLLEKTITKEEVERLKDMLRSEGHMVKDIGGVEERVLGIVGHLYKESSYYESLPGVEKAVPISKPYKLVSRELHPEASTIKVGDVAVGGGRLVVIAGPCGVEDRKTTLDIARVVRKHGAVLFRGGAFKPRTSPYAFQGLGEGGLKILREVREETGLGIVSEMTSPSQADLMMKYVDIVQIGARNMQNFELLKSVGRIGKPVLLKRGLSATIEEWLMSAEYILSEGNDQVILCERGIRTFERYTRNTLDLTAVPVVKKLTHLPIIVDPSHATGIREKVSPMARAAIAAGADGLIIEVHTDPDKALSDGPQSLYPEQFEQLMRDLYVIAPVVGKQLDYAYLDKATAMKPRRGEGRAPATVAYSGVPGSFSHKACMQFFGDEVPLRNGSSFREVFDLVDSEQAAFGVVPVENSLTGSIHENYDLLLEFDLKIVGELTLRIKHNLYGQPNAPIEGLERIYSHPQVFQQCREYLEKKPRWDLIACKDTASAFRRVNEGSDPKEAAIAGEGDQSPEFYPVCCHFKK
jgi:3-deoxy-7-phosphoheptulonate synthase